MTHLLIVIIYLAFISLGLPDAVLGGSWPTMYQEFGVPVGYASVITTIITLGTIISSLLSDRITLRFGTGKVTALSVALTAVALLGFATSHSFLMLCIWAVPYGLGAGGVDASLNNYVALHYNSRVMSWLHCMWGVGATAGPYVLGFLLTRGGTWNDGYGVISILQILLSLVIFLSLPLWKKRGVAAEGAKDATEPKERKPLSLREIFRIPGAKEIMITFLCYCVVEQTAGVWAASYLVLVKGVGEEQAASYAAMFYIGITAGRFLNGLIATKLTDKQMIHLGMIVLLTGLLVLFVPAGEYLCLAAFILIGVGCAPIYPCIIHSTPWIFGEENSQAIIGVQMASAYTGGLIMPPLFGMLIGIAGIKVLPIVLILMFALMVFMYEKLLRRAKRNLETIH